MSGLVFCANHCKEPTSVCALFSSSLYCGVSLSSWSSSVLLVVRQTLLFQGCLKASIYPSPLVCIQT
eukprot:9009305-Prorocentrum_lima.AAC.1